MVRILISLILFLNVSYSFASVIFKPNKNVYKKGETICFYIENKTGKEIILPSSAPWVVFDKDRPLFAPIATQKIIKLKPNEKKKWCWKQIDFDKNKILSGEYTVRLTVFQNGKKKFLSFKVKIEPNYTNAK